MKKKLKSLLQQAELYRSQGLLDEAQKRYEIAIGLVKKADQIKDKQKYINAINKKMKALNGDLQEFGKAPTIPEMSGNVNTLIKKLFSFSGEETDKDRAALEGAIALAKFGQFESALEEFKHLISIETLRVAAAKNILRCYLELGASDKAVEQFSDWQSGELFTGEQLGNVRNFFDDILDKKGIQAELSNAVSSGATVLEDPKGPELTMDVEPASVSDSEEDDDGDFLDISAVAITLDSGSRKGEQIELDVSFQSGNIISLIISSKDAELIENLKVGVRLDDVQYYSPIAIFRGSGVVSAKTQIKSGPKKGDYSLDIKIESI